MRKVTTVITDDLDGSPGAEPHTITVDGFRIEIDLCPANTSKLYTFLRPYLEAGRKVAGSRRRNPHSEPPPAGSNATAIRAWWKDNPDGLPTWQARGAVPAAVVRAWQTKD